MDYVLMDVSNLMHRHFHGAHGADWPDRPKAALHGFVRDIPKYLDRFGAAGVAFAFDAPPYKRHGLFPGYKAGTAPRSVPDEQAAAIEEMHALVKRMGQGLLNKVGFTNVHARLGYEADDLAWAVREGLSDGDRVVCVTGDKDGYQLLDGRFAIYHPIQDRFVTADTFRADYGIEPRQWVDVQCLAGGKNGLEGCPGVAEKTAIKYVRGELPPHHKAYKDILGFTRCGGVTQNAELAELPFPGLSPIKLSADPPFGKLKWGPVCDLLGVGPMDLFPDQYRREIREVG